LRPCAPTFERFDARQPTDPCSAFARDHRGIRAVEAMTVGLLGYGVSLMLLVLFHHQHRHVE
jgi:hypothetical protein